MTQFADKVISFQYSIEEGVFQKHMGLFTLDIVKFLSERVVIKSMRDLTSPDINISAFWQFCMPPWCYTGFK